MATLNPSNDFADYVEHPHYGRGPRYTDLQVDPRAAGVNLHSNTGSMYPLSDEFLASMPVSFQIVLPLLPTAPAMIEGTAVVADVSRQPPYFSGPVTHYFDVRSKCRDCQRLFIFFADEQKKYYEEFKLSFDVQAVRCFPCRKNYQHRKRLQKRYGTLRTKFPECTPHELLALVEVMLDLIELKVFKPEKLNDVRRFLKLIPEDVEQREAVAAAWAKVEALR